MPILPSLLNMFKGGAQTAPDEAAQQRVDKYRRKGWAPDDTIDMDLWGAQSQPQGEESSINNPTPSAPMFGQFGDAKKTMGNIWDQLKGGGQKIGKGLQQFGSDWEANYEKQLKSQGLWEGADNTNPYGAFNSKPTDASESVNTYEEAIGPPAPGEKPYPEVSGNAEEELYPAGKNIFGGATEPITKSSIDEMGQNFVMGGFGGGGGGFGKMWSNIRNWMR